jgi:hypothetical protein
MIYEVYISTWEVIDRNWNDIEETWDSCIQPTDAEFVTWDNTDLVWESDIYTWDECLLVKQIVEELGWPGGIIEEKVAEVYDKYKNNTQFIKLVCKVKGEKYEKTKVIKNIQIFINNVKLVAQSVLNVNVKIDL